jgi:hypothetical protein
MGADFEKQSKSKRKGGGNYDPDDRIMGGMPGAGSMTDRSPTGL